MNVSTLQIIVNELGGDTHVVVATKEGGDITEFKSVIAASFRHGVLVMDAPNRWEGIQAAETTKSALAVQVGTSDYRLGTIQPVQFLEANPQIPFSMMQVIKEASRVNTKGSTQKERDANTILDLNKCIHYCQLYAEIHGLKLD